MARRLLRHLPPIEDSGNMGPGVRRDDAELVVRSQNFFLMARRRSRLEG
jgi:hypothetical protein